MMTEVPRTEVPAEFLAEAPAPAALRAAALDVPAPTVRTDTGPEITPRQTAFLNSLLDERELDPKLGLSVEEIRAKVADLSKRDASRWITRLLELPKRPPQRSGPGSYPDVPAGRYAVRTTEDGPIGAVIKFYRVDRPTEGRWAGFTFLAVQASDELHPIKNPDVKRTILGLIAENPAAASKLYGQEIGSCGVCGRTLTDETSRAYGIGPVCRENTGW